jgi:hypothetical protein
MAALDNIRAGEPEDPFNLNDYLRLAEQRVASYGPSQARQDISEMYEAAEWAAGIMYGYDVATEESL